MKYITIDFETASYRLDSACSIGIVGVVDGRIDFEYYSLINPEVEFSLYNISIHNINPEDVIEKPTFKELWPTIKQYIDGSIVFAHNASFDIGVLKAMIERYNLDAPKIKWGCTLKIARRVWGNELVNHKLSTLANHLGLDHLHHHALSDSLVCYEIIKRAIKVMQVDDADDLYESLGIRYGVYDNEKLLPSTNKYKKSKKSPVVDNELLKEKVVYLSGKPKSMTKKELINNLKNNGAFIENNLLMSINYFVMLGNSPKAKLSATLNLISKGANIEIIDEQQLLGMLYEKVYQKQSN